MVLERVPGISDPQTAFLVERLVTYTDDLIAAHVTPLPPPVLPDITPNSKGDDLMAVAENGGGNSGSNTGGTQTIPPPVLPPIVANSKDM